MTTTAQPGLHSQGMQLQGMQLQGMQLQGMQLQGMQLQGMQLQGMQLQGMQLQGSTLTGVATGPGGSSVVLAGADLIGARLTGTDGQGQQMELTISDVQVDPRDPDGELQVYTVSYWDRGSGTWQNACAADLYGERWAIPVAGIWDRTGAHVDSKDQFTFACTQGVIAKCMRWGYRPWRTVNGVSMQPLHQACTRMARADYCGNGVTHTLNGTLIDMYDIYGVSVRVPNDGMMFEAAWTPDGAHCVNKERWQLVGALVALECPDKLRLPGLDDLLNPDPCLIKLGNTPRSAALISNRSFLKESLQTPIF